jgi:hypothetical protein
MGSVRRGPRSSDTNAEQATPKSTPQLGRRFGGAGLAAIATPNETCQPSASLAIEALRTMPPRGRDSRNRTHPSFGSLTSAHLREHLRT